MKKLPFRRFLSCPALCALLTGMLPASASAVPPKASGTQFRDVSASHPAAASIRRCAELGFLQGETASSFGMGKSLARGDFVAALNRVFGWETVRPERPSYQDVPVSSGYYTAVETAAANGALTGQTDTFRPAESITREEAAVMLVRALGYANLAGPAQDLPIPYRDVRTNLGYITIAYDFSLIDGTSGFTFSPSDPLKREDAAVSLVRLYDKIQNPASRGHGVAASLEDVPEGCATAAIPALRLMYTGQPNLVSTMDPEEAAKLREALQTSGVTALLCVTGGPTSLNGTPAETAAVLAEAVKTGGYDGLYLDLGSFKGSQGKLMTRLVRHIKDALGDTPFYLVADAPVWHGEGSGDEDAGGYDCDILGQIADKLILRLPTYAGEEGADLPTAPIEPLEELYYALGQLRGAVDWSRLAILATTTGNLYINGKESGELSRAELLELLENETAAAHYFDRYGCSYLTARYEEKNTEYRLSAWYLDQQALEARSKMAALFGVNQVFISSFADLPAAAPAA